MNLSDSIWFFCIVYTSLTGTFAYGIWKLAERFLRKRKKYNWIIFSSKLVILFWTVPFVFLIALEAARVPGGWKDDFGITPVLYVILKNLFYIWAAGFLWQVFQYLAAACQWKWMRKYSLVSSDEERDILLHLFLWRPACVCLY